MPMLRDIVATLDDFDDEAVIYTDGASPAARAAAITDAEVEGAKADGLRYFLEVALAKDAVIVWSEWRGGAEPSTDDKLMAVSYYATHDAYLPSTDDMATARIEPLNDFRGRPGTRPAIADSTAKT
ncbi:MAG: hypothetical protein ACJ780_14600 [Solirubrobacteraceae bacterium]